MMSEDLVSDSVQLTVGEFYERHQEELGLDLITGKEGLARRISLPEVQRPGLSLTGYLKSFEERRLLVFGKVELEYLSELSAPQRMVRLTAILGATTPAIIIARRFTPPPELHTLCESQKVPLFGASLKTTTLLGKLSRILSEEFAPTVIRHGTLVEVFGIGILIQGESNVGKSEAALGLIERGHRLVSDDAVCIRAREGYFLEGYGSQITRHHMEIRGIGLINVASLYGAVCVREVKRLDLVVHLEAWNDNYAYDLLGRDDKLCEILDVKLPFHVLPLKPGRDVVLLLETIALRHRLMKMGINAAHELSSKLEAVMAQKR